MLSPLLFSYLLFSLIFDLLSNLLLHLLARHQKVHTNPGGGGGRGRKANSANAAANAAAAASAAAAVNATNVVVGNLQSQLAPATNSVTALNLLSPNTAAAAAVAAAASNKMVTNQSLSGLIGTTTLPLFPTSIGQIRNGVDTTSPSWVTHLVDGRAIIDAKDANGLSLTARRD